jgi:endonuclease YncB( thermonuclease family)
VSRFTTALVHGATTLALASILPIAVAAQRDLPPSQHRRDLIGKHFDARVVRVGDGDTFDVQIAGETRRLRIRLEGIDAPELSEAYGRESTTYLRTLVIDQMVRIVGRDMDRYGRLVARVSVQGRDASTAMLRAGLACHAYARDAALAREESQAQAAGVGFWARSAKKPRCVAR